MHWLTHVGVVFRASINSRVLSVGPFPTTEAVAGCEAMQDQKGIVVLSPDNTLMFLHTRGKLTTSLVHIGAGAVRARDAIHDIPPSLRGKGAFACTSAFRRDFVGLRVMVGLYERRCLALSSDTPWT